MSVLESSDDYRSRPPPPVETFDESTPFLAVNGCYDGATSQLIDDNLTNGVDNSSGSSTVTTTNVDHDDEEVRHDADTNCHDDKMVSSLLSTPTTGQSINSVGIEEENTNALPLTCSRQLVEQCSVDNDDILDDDNTVNPTTVSSSSSTNHPSNSAHCESTSSRQSPASCTEPPDSTSRISTNHCLTTTNQLTSDSQITRINNVTVASASPIAPQQAPRHSRKSRQPRKLPIAVEWSLADDSMMTMTTPPSQHKVGIAAIDNDECYATVNSPVVNGDEVACTDKLPSPSQQQKETDVSFGCLDNNPAASTLTTDNIDSQRIQTDDCLVPRKLRKSLRLIAIASDGARKQKDSANAHEDKTSSSTSVSESSSSISSSLRPRRSLVMAKLKSVEDEGRTRLRRGTGAEGRRSTGGGGEAVGTLTDAELDKWLADDNVDTIQKYGPASLGCNTGDFLPADKANIWLSSSQQPSYLAPHYSHLQLHPYQLEGVRWLWHAYHYQGGDGQTAGSRSHAILADEMGLGKTIQVIALLYSLWKEESNFGPFLIIAPLSTLLNWKREFDQWAPDFHVLVYTGDRATRSLMREYEFYVPKSNGLPAFHVLVTSYEIASIDRVHLTPFDWTVLVVDEAHRLKNKKSKLFREFSQYTTDFKLLLTGTPLQNNLEELFHLLEFIDRDKFANLHELSQQWAIELDREQRVERLHDLLKHHLLRRLKADVVKDLPKKTEYIVPVDMTSLQRRLYKHVITKNYHELRTGNLMNSLIHLQKVCNHPYLLEAGDAIAPRLPPSAKEGPPVGDPQLHVAYEPRAMIQASGKLIVMMQLLNRLLSQPNDSDDRKIGGHRVLIFSRLTMTLNLLEIVLTQAGYAYERIDGGVRGPLRQVIIDRFNSPNSDASIFLLSTRAGGEGINLASADTVILYDSDWNPHCDLQALSRSHRIGQSRHVVVYRFITRHSMEERIQAVARRKLALTDLVVNNNNNNKQAQSKSGTAAVTTSKPGKQLNRSELDELIRSGLDALFAVDESCSGDGLQQAVDELMHSSTPLVYDSASIDRLLDRSKLVADPDHQTTAVNDLLSCFRVPTFATKTPANDPSTTPSSNDPETGKEIEEEAEPHQKAESTTTIPVVEDDGEDESNLCSTTMAATCSVDFWDDLLKERHAELVKTDIGSTNTSITTNSLEPILRTCRVTKFITSTSTNQKVTVHKIVNVKPIQRKRIVGGTNRRASKTVADLKAKSSRPSTMDEVEEENQEELEQDVPSPVATIEEEEEEEDDPSYIPSDEDPDADDDDQEISSADFEQDVGEVDDVWDYEEENARSFTNRVKRSRPPPVPASHRSVKRRRPSQEQPNNTKLTHVHVHSASSQTMKPPSSNPFPVATHHYRPMVIDLTKTPDLHPRATINSAGNRVKDDDVIITQPDDDRSNQVPACWQPGPKACIAWAKYIGQRGKEKVARTLLPAPDNPNNRYLEARRVEVLHVFGFGPADRLAFVSAVMRWGLPPPGIVPPPDWLPVNLRKKPATDLLSYTCLFMQHIYQDPAGMDESATTWTDGLPKEGICVPAVLSRLAMLALIRRKVGQFEDNNGVHSDAVLQSNIKRPFRFTIHDGGLTQLRLIWLDEWRQVYEAIQQSIGTTSDSYHQNANPNRLPGRRKFNNAGNDDDVQIDVKATEQYCIRYCWHSRHDYWLLAGLHVHGYLRWNEILADPRFAILNDGLVSVVVPPGARKTSADGQQDTSSTGGKILTKPRSVILDDGLVSIAVPPGGRAKTTMSEQQGVSSTDRSYTSECHAFLVTRLRLLEHALMVEEALYQVARAALSRSLDQSSPSKELGNELRIQNLAICLSSRLTATSTAGRKRISLPKDSVSREATRAAVQRLQELLDDIHADLPGLPASVICSEEVEEQDCQVFENRDGAMRQLNDLKSADHCTITTTPSVAMETTDGGTQCKEDRALVSDKSNEHKSVSEGAASAATQAERDDADQQPVHRLGDNAKDGASSLNSSSDMSGVVTFPDDNKPSITAERSDDVIVISDEDTK